LFAVQATSLTWGILLLITCESLEHVPRCISGILKALENYFLLLLRNMQFVEKQHEDLDEDIDLRAMENGFISVTPLNIHGQVEADIGAPVSDWLSAVVSLGKEKEAAPATADQQIAGEEKEDPSAA